MKNYIQSNVRVQFLSEEIVRLELGKKGVFCDENTLFVAAKSDFDGVEIDVVNKPDGTYVTHGNVSVFVPAEAKNLSGAKLFVDGKIEYVYKFLRNSGELPALDKTPAVFALSDNPRVVLPAEGYAPVEQNGNGYVIDDKAVDVYLLVCRGDAAKLRKLYVQLTGRAELVRMGTLGCWNSRYYKYNQQQAEQMILDYQAHDIPLDNIVLDTDWRAASDRGIGYEFDTKLFPDMNGYFRFAHEHDVEVMFNDHPEPLDGATSCIDKNEVAYRTAHLAEHLNNGLDYWWYDRNWNTKLLSPVEGVTAETWGMHIYSDTTKHVWQQKAKNKQIYRRSDIMSNVDNVKDGLYCGISNSASHRYSVQWTGDSTSDLFSIGEAMDDIIRCGDNAVPYAHPDCGGHIGNPDKAAYIRWLQMCSFAPVLRPHCTNTVVRFREPWAYDDKFVEDTARDYINLRYRLLPLIYTEAYKAYRDGSPICRAMGWNYPTDKKALSCKGQFMLGSDILVAPMYDGDYVEVPQNAFATPVSVTYYNGTMLEGDLIAKVQKSVVRIDCDGTSPDDGVPVYDYSALFEANLLVKKDYRFYVEADDGVRVWIDNELRVDDWSVHATKRYDVGIVSANTMHKLRVEYFQAGGAARLNMFYTELADQISKAVYLPKGRWLNLFSGKIHEGGKTIRVKTDNLAAMPLFVRMGAAVVTAHNARNTKVQKWDKLTVDIFPDKTSWDGGFLYEDDRNTTAYKVGQFRTTDYSVACDDGQSKITFTLQPSQGEFKGKYATKTRKIKVKYHLLGDCADVKEVLVNGQAVKTMLRSRKKSEFPLSDSNYAADSRLLTFEFAADVDKMQTVEFLLIK